MGDSEAAVGLDGLKDLEGAGGGENKTGKKYSQVGAWSDVVTQLSLTFPCFHN